MPTLDEGPEQEPAFNMTALDRYYNDVCDEPHYLGEVIIAVESLFEAEQLLDDDTDRENLRRRITQLTETAEDDQHRIERYLMIPITMLAPYIEVTKPINEVRAWYKDAIEWTLLFAKPEHDEACLEEMEEVNPTACHNSLECPIVELAKNLVDPVFNPDFDDVSYLIDTQHAHNVAQAKLLMARSYKLGDKQLMSVNLTSYLRDFAVRNATIATREEPEKLT
jgi:hypothetical protein